MATIHEITEKAGNMSKWEELKRLAEAATPGPWVAKDWASTDSDGAIDVCGVSVMSPKEMCGIFTVSLEGDETNDVDYIAAANPAAILDLIAERDALAADAARYRWLCEHQIVPSPSLWDDGIGIVCKLNGLTRRGTTEKATLDAAIDAAMKGE